MEPHFVLKIFAFSYLSEAFPFSEITRDTHMQSMFPSFRNLAAFSLQSVFFVSFFPYPSLFSTRIRALPLQQRACLTPYPDPLRYKEKPRPLIVTPFYYDESSILSPREKSSP